MAQPLQWVQAVDLYFEALFVPWVSQGVPLLQLFEDCKDDLSPSQSAGHPLVAAGELPLAFFRPHQKVGPPLAPQPYPAWPPLALAHCLAVEEANLLECLSQGGDGGGPVRHCVLQALPSVGRLVLSPGFEPPCEAQGFLFGELQRQALAWV